MTLVTRLYGLTVRSVLPLHQERPARRGSNVDLDITLGQPIPATDVIPEGRILLLLRSQDQLYVAVETPDDYLLRFFGTCDVSISTDLTAATIRPVKGADPAILSVLAGGTLLAFVLTMLGTTVLHGSAVQIGGCALAFVGASGMGKSTMATLQAADGARLITDDLLRVDLTNNPPTCSLGATELRLRKAAGDLAARFDHAPRRRTTGDERDALRPPDEADEGLPLKAIVVPFPDKDSPDQNPQIERLDGMTAFLMLSRFPRLLGWESQEVLGRQFQQLGDLVDKVPVYAARLPWGPPFRGDLAAIVRAAVDLA